MILWNLTCTVYALELCALCVFASTGVRLLRRVYIRSLSQRTQQILHTINTFSMVLSVMSTYSQHSSPNSTSQPTMVSLLRCAVFTAFCQRTSQLCIHINTVSTQKKSLHSPVSLVIYSSTVAEWNPFFLFSLSDLLVPSFPHSLISVPPFTLLSLPVTSHIRPFCTLLFVPFFNARAPLFLQSFPHKTLKALIPVSATFYEEIILQHWLCFTFSCWVFDILKQHFFSTNNFEPRSCTRHQVMTKS